MIMQLGFPFAALIDLGGPQQALDWGWFRITLANLVIVVLLVLVFILAVALPFPRGRDEPPPGMPGGARTGADPGWTARVRTVLETRLPWERLLPSVEPAFVSTWTYTFGVATLAALVAVMASGGILALNGPTWHLASRTGAYVDSVHYWSVQLFFFFLVLHLMAQLFQASWRGGRGLTWLIGGVAFSAAIVTSLTGYLSQQNFEAQWVATQAKDGVNAAGLARVFNPMNGGQVLTLHVVLLPAALAGLVVLHIMLVRLRGICPPIDARREFEASPSSRPGVPDVRS